MKPPPGDPRGHRSADVIVIGAGATGALVAYTLAKAGMSVLVLEKGNCPGYGASSRSAACIRAQFDDPETVIGMMYSQWFYNNFYDVLGVASNGRPASILTKVGYLFLYENPNLAVTPEKQDALSERWLKAKCDAAIQGGLGLPVEILHSDDVHSRWPHLNI